MRDGVHAGGVEGDRADAVDGAADGDGGRPLPTALWRGVGKRRLRRAECADDNGQLAGERALHEGIGVGHYAAPCCTASVLIASMRTAAAASWRVSRPP